MRTAQQDAPARTRTVSGYVAASGSVTAGTEFVVTKGTAGIYTVRFRPRFRAVLGVQVSLTTGGFAVVSFSAPNSDDLNIWTYSTATAATDIGFLFTAQGIAL